jgi:hypothetical protein
MAQMCRGRDTYQGARRAQPQSVWYLSRSRATRSLRIRHGTAIVEMQQHVDGLQKNIDVLKKVKSSLGG